MAADLAVQPEKLDGKPGEVDVWVEEQFLSDQQAHLAEGTHSEHDTVDLEAEKPSGAKLAALLPFPDKFHAAAKLAGAPLHEATGLDDAHRLILYALFRQANDGPCVDPRPSVFDPAATAKHMAYGRLGNMNPLEAMFLYTRTLEEEKPDIWDAYVEGGADADSGSGMEKGADAAEGRVEDVDREIPSANNSQATEDTKGGGHEERVGWDAEVVNSVVSVVEAQQEMPEELLKPNDCKASPANRLQVHVSPKKMKARLPNVPRESGKLDALFSDALQLNKLPSREAANKHLSALEPDLQSLVRRMIFVVELLSNQADLSRKVREAVALRKALNVPGGVDREIGIKVKSLVECGELVIGVIERELADWTAAISEELAAGPMDMIADRGAFGFKHLPQLAKLKVSWQEHLSDWQAMKEEIPSEEKSQFSIYNMLFTNIAS